MEHKQNLKLATSLALLAAVAMAIMSALVKLLGNDIATTTTLFFRFLISLLLFLPWFLKDSALFKIAHPKQFVLRCVFAFLALSCLYYALKYTSVANAIVLNNTNALFMPIIAWFMLRAYTPFKVWLAIITGFIGVVLILHPSKNIFTDVGSLVGLASGVFGAIALLQLRQLTKVTSTQQVLFFYFLTGLIISAVLLPFFWHMPNIHDWIILIGVGIASAFYQLFLSLSFKYAPARIMTVILFSAIGFGVLFDWLLWNKFPGLLSIVGICIVIGSGMMVVLLGQQLVRRK